MDIHPQFSTPRPPLLLTRNLGPEDSSLAMSIQGHLRGIKKGADQLTAGVALYEVSKRNNLIGLYKEWAFMGARAGAMAIRNYGHALAKIRKVVGRIEPWKGSVDLKALKEAEASFQKAFPAADKLRHSVAHPELYSDPNKQMGTSKADEARGAHLGGRDTVVQDSIFGDQFTATFEGEVVQYSVTSASAVSLIQITTQIFDAFQDLNRSGQPRGR